MINSDRILNIYTAVLLDSILNSEFNLLNDREKEIVLSAKDEFKTIDIPNGTNILTGFLSSYNTDSSPVILSSLFDFKNSLSETQTSLLELLNYLYKTIDSYIAGNLSKETEEYKYTIRFLQYFNNEYDKKIYLSNIHINSLVYA